MQFELTIRGDSFEEIASIFVRNVALPGAVAPKNEDENPELRSKEVEPELPAKKSRSKKVDVAKPGTPDTNPESSDGETAAGSAPPSEDEPVTFEDLRAKASSLMDSGKVDGRAIQAMLEDKFGVKAFGPLPEEQYPAALAELENLAA